MTKTTQTTIPELPLLLPSVWKMFDEIREDMKGRTFVEISECSLDRMSERDSFGDDILDVLIEMYGPRTVVEEVAKVIEQSYLDDPESYTDLEIAK
jgi:hypothetical protein